MASLGKPRLVNSSMLISDICQSWLGKLEEQTMSHRTIEKQICDFCDSDITNKIQIRETETSTFFLCTTCASFHDLHEAEDVETKNVISK